LYTVRFVLQGQVLVNALTGKVELPKGTCPVCRLTRQVELLAGLPYQSATEGQGSLQP
jgi:hypothetical protein